MFLFAFDIFRLPLYLAVIIFFILLFFWRDREKDYFMDYKNKKEDWLEISWWILAPIVTPILVEQFFN